MAAEAIWRASSSLSSSSLRVFLTSSLVRQSCQPTCLATLEGTSGRENMKDMTRRATSSLTSSGAHCRWWHSPTTPWNVAASSKSII